MYNIQGVGYSRYEHGELFITTSDGSNITKTQVAPLQSDGMPHAELNYFYGYNNYHPQMAIVGNTIHLMYRGAQPNSSEIGDRKHMLYQKSTDFGKTWANAYSLPASEDGQGMIAAKGQNVYILTSETAPSCYLLFA